MYSSSSGAQLSVGGGGGGGGGTDPWMVEVLCQLDCRPREGLGQVGDMRGGGGGGMKEVSAISFWLRRSVSRRFSVSTVDIRYKSRFESWLRVCFGFAQLPTFLGLSRVCV